MTEHSDMVPAITGCNGFVGSYLASRLRAEGWQVVGMARSAGPGVSPMPDLSQKFGPDELLPTLQGVHTVIHCAALAHQPLSGGRAALDFRKRVSRINRDAVIDLAEACVRAEVKRFLFFSTAKVYGDRSVDGKAFRETDSPAPADAYGTAKKEAEDALRPFAERGLEVCCLRLPLVYGPTFKANLLRLERLSSLGLPLPFRSIRNRRNLLGLSNLGSVVDALLRAPAWPYFEMNIADPEPVSTPELVRALAARSLQKARLFPCSPRLLRGSARLIGQQSQASRLLNSFELSTERLHSAFPGLTMQSTLAAIQAPEPGYMESDPRATGESAR